MNSSSEYYQEEIEKIVNMKTLNEFLDGLKRLELIHKDTDDCEASYHTECALNKADKIIREMKKTLEVLSIPMTMRASDEWIIKNVNKTISQILNEEDK